MILIRFHFFLPTFHSLTVVLGILDHLLHLWGTALHRKARCSPLHCLRSHATLDRDGFRVSHTLGESSPRMYENLGTIEKTSFAPFLSAYASRYLEKFRWRLFQLGSRSSQVEHSMMPCSPNGLSTYQHSSSPHPNFEFLREVLETLKFKTSPSMFFKPPT